MATFLPAALEFLHYGILGLAVLFVYLGYRLTYRVIELPKVSAHHASLAELFLKVACLVLIVGGLMELTSHYFRLRPITVEAYVSAKSSSDSYGKVIINSRANNRTEITGERLESSFYHNEIVAINVTELHSNIDKLRGLIKENEGTKNEGN